MTLTELNDRRARAAKNQSVFREVNEQIEFVAVEKIGQLERVVETAERYLIIEKSEQLARLAHAGRASSAEHDS